jgi:transcriptional regulator with XRE-family HTH domain
VDSDADQQARYKAERARLQRGLAKNLVRLRGERTQEEVAAKANLHPTSIGYFERGKREPSMSTLLILAAAYGVSVNQIVEGLPTPKERKPPPPDKGIARVDRAHGIRRAPD